MAHGHVTAPTQFVEASGIRFAYCRFGQEGGTPLLFTQRFPRRRDQDLEVPDGFAINWPVILFDASSSAETSDTMDAMAEHVADFVGALGLLQSDLDRVRIIAGYANGSHSNEGISAPLGGPTPELQLPAAPKGWSRKSRP